MSKDVKQDLDLMKDLLIELASELNSLAVKVSNLAYTVKEFAEEECVGLELALSEAKKAIVGLSQMDLQRLFSPIENQIKERRQRRQELGLETTLTYCDPGLLIPALSEFFSSMRPEEAAGLDLSEIENFVEIELKYESAQDLTGEDLEFLVALAEKHSVKPLN